MERISAGKGLREVEEEFKSDRLKDRHLYYDLYMKADAEEAKSFLLGLLPTFELEPIAESATSLEEELPEFLRRGLRPVRHLIKARREFARGVRFSTAFKFFGFLAALSLFLFLTSFALPALELHRNLLFLFLMINSSFAIGFHRLKEKVRFDVWIKLAGIVDREQRRSDLRLIIAGESNKKDALKELEEDLNELHNAVAKKYLRGKKVEAKPLLSKEKREKLAEELKKVREELDALSSRLAEGEISEDVYREAKEDLEKRREKLELLFDIVD